MAKDIHSLTARLLEVRTQWWDLAFDEDYPGVLGAPATTNEVGRLISRVGRPLPSSYQAFLLAHDGWTEFSGDARLLSTTDRDEEWFRDTRALFAESLMPDPSPFDRYIPVVVGHDTRLAVFFDPETMSEAGEMEVVELHDCEEVHRHEDLPSFFEARIAIHEYLIDAEQNGDEP